MATDFGLGWSKILWYYNLQFSRQKVYEFDSFAVKSQEEKEHSLTRDFILPVKKANHYTTNPVALKSISLKSYLFVSKFHFKIASIHTVLVPLTTLVIFAKLLFEHWNWHNKLFKN